MHSNNLDEALLLSDRIIPMTRGPRATLGPPVVVDLPRPRSAEQCSTTNRRFVPDAYRRIAHRSRARGERAPRPDANRAPWSFPRPWCRPTRARPTHEPHRAARTDGADQGVSHTGRPLRRGEGRQPARSAFRVHLHRRALGLRQVHRALDHRRPSTGHARRRRHQGPSDDRARRRQGRRLSDALPAPVVDRQGERVAGGEAEVPPLEGRGQTDSRGTIPRADGRGRRHG